MRYRTMGNSGTVVSVQALGTMTFGAEADETTSGAIIEAYIAAGGNLIDTADVYSKGVSEEIIGRWLAAHPTDAEQLVVATKGRFPMGPGANDYGASRRHLAEALDASLTRLGVESVDLYQVHAWDALTPVEETLRFLDDAVRAGLQRRLDGAPVPPSALSRRSVLAATGLATAAVVVTTAGETLPALAPLNVLAPRRLRYGPQGLPINRTAAEAKVQRTALDPAWRLTIRGPERSVDLSLADLRAMPQTDAGLPIACVEGWSTQAAWRGVPVRDLAALVGATGRELLVRSFAKGAYSSTILQREFADDPLTLVALELNGETLHVDHGYPARLISPARPGVLQTKWLRSLEVR